MRKAQQGTSLPALVGGEQLRYKKMIKKTWRKEGKAQGKLSGHITIDGA